MDDPTIIREAIFKVIDNQMKQNDPPETNITYKRLEKEGYSKEDTKKLIAQCVAVELYNGIKRKQPFNLERYLRNLKNLPEEP